MWWLPDAFMRAVLCSEWAAVRMLQPRRALRAARTGEAP